MAAEKAAWRARFRAARRALSPAARAAASARIVGRLAAVVDGALGDGARAGDGAGTETRAVALFWPLSDEPDLRPLADALRQRGAAVALPVVVGPRRMVWRAYRGPRRLAPGPWGLSEPDAG